MFEVSAKWSGRLRLETSAVVLETESLADRLLRIMIAQNQISLLSFGAKATGGTVRSIRAGLRVSTATYQRRQVLAGGGYKFIVSGRRPGAKMPVRLVAGASKRGGRVFEPLPEMLAWFIIKGIPRSAWFPIMRSISIRGIKPRDIPGRALNAARPLINREVKLTGQILARQIIVRAK